VGGGVEGGAYQCLLHVNRGVAALEVLCIHHTKFTPSAQHTRGLLRINHTKFTSPAHYMRWMKGPRGTLKSSTVA
jgi:hypothetical protein